MSVREELNDDRVRDLIEGLFVPQRSDACLERLRGAGSRAVPFLVAAMRDSRVSATAFSPPYGLPDFSAPLFRMSTLLEESGSPAAAAPFLEFLESADERLRKHGAMELGSLALENCTEPVNRLLAGPDKELRQYAMMGIGHALKAKRGAPAFFQAVRPALANRLSEPDIFGYAPKLLVQIDSLHATPILTEPDRLSLQNPQLRGTLEALNQAHAAVPREILLQLIAELEPQASNYLRARELGEVLFAYARNPDAQTETKLRALLQSPVEEVQSRAARALAAWHGLEDIYGKLLKVAHGPGTGAMSQPERNYWFATSFHYEIQNGGPWQYFSNADAGDDPLNVAALRAIGATRSADMLEAAANVFSSDGGVAQDEEDESDESGRSIVEELFSDYGVENIEMLADVYAVEHRADFRNCAVEN